MGARTVECEMRLTLKTQDKHAVLVHEHSIWPAYCLSLLRIGQRSLSAFFPFAECARVCLLSSTPARKEKQEWRESEVVYPYAARYSRIAPHRRIEPGEEKRRASMAAVRD